MTCKEAEGIVMPYIRNELTDEELYDFLEHVMACPECKEELEIYYTVEVGIRQLEADSGSYNIKGALEAAIEQSRHHLQLAKLLKIMRYAVSTLGVMALMITALLQIRIWWQWGLF